MFVRLHGSLVGNIPRYDRSQSSLKINPTRTLPPLLSPDSTSAPHTESKEWINYFYYGWCILIILLIHSTTCIS